MFPDLPPLEKIKLKQSFEAPTGSDLQALDACILLLPDSAREKPWPDWPQAGLLAARYRKLLDRPRHWLTHLPDEKGTPLAVGFLESGRDDAFARLSLARKLAARLPLAAERVGVSVAGLTPEEAGQAAEAVVAALLVGAFRLPAAKSKPAPPPALAEIRLLGLDRKLDLRRTAAAARGNNLARWLTALPGNALTPGSYRRRLEKLAESRAWRLEFLDETALKKKRAGAFLAVTQASPERDAGIARLRYTPPGGQARRRPVILAGKGICFDTGGTNLKNAKGMYGMHGDMQGSAVALGLFLALSELKVDFPVECWLALAQNHIGPRAYKPNDVIRASNGLHIEIVHTDAEGRMVLADTLALACREKPALLLDFATLTGACVYSLGTAYSGAFTNRIELAETLIRAGRESGERVWPFPNDTDYDEQLDSQVADIKQCLIPGEADHILAARFLNRFVEAAVPWVHIDLSAGEHKDGLAHVPTEITGFGVRFGLSLLLDHLPEAA